VGVVVFLSTAPRKVQSSSPTGGAVASSSAGANDSGASETPSPEPTATPTPEPTPPVIAALWTVFPITSVLADTDQPLSIEVDDCYGSCQMTWHIDGVLVTVTVDAQGATTYFVGHSVIGHRFAAGLHHVVVDVWDGLGRHARIEGDVLSIVAKHQSIAPPETDTLPLSAPTHSPSLLLIALGLVSLAEAAKRLRVIRR
jgi:hypothetical protein